MFLRLFCLWTLLLSFAGAQEPVFINEFMASNATGIRDENSDFSDWIELRNASASPVNLAGYYLTDNPSNLRKWRLPSTNIAANGYIIIYASGKDRVTPRLHTDFSLSADGEYLAFVKPDGVTKITEFTDFGIQFRDTSYGLDATGTNWVYFTTGSPGGPNTNAPVAFAKAPKFSQNRGYYTNAFDLSISSETAGATIRYTTNGTLPTLANGINYTNSVGIRVSRTSVIRAAAFRTGMQPSPVVTSTYLFLDDIIQQSPTGAPPPGWPASWGGNVVNYGMDPNVVNDPLYRDTIKNDMKTLPCFSIVMNVDDLFNATTGIYANPGQDGRTWERMCSVEYIRTDGEDGFHINAGIRIRGGFSRSTDNPKHAFRLFFREEYGDSKLRYPLFGDNGTDEFNNLDLRTFQNYSWSFQGDGSGVFIRDLFSRDTQLAMGHHAERGDYCHLYINGIYWGIYNTCERPEASYGETYWGGKKDDYDVVKVEAGPYTINATDGNLTAWTQLYTLASRGLSSNDAYFNLLGQNADGTTNPARTNYVDVINMIDYMLVIFYGGNLDAPISNFLGNDRPNNWYGLRNRDGLRGGFRFLAHDSEHTLLPWDIAVNRLGPFAAGQNGLVYSNPQYIFQQMSANAEFKLLVADRIHRYYFNNGVLTPAAASARFRKRMAELDRAVVGESARWGDSKREPAYTRATWVAACNDVLNNWLPRRSATNMLQYRAAGFYPATVAPSFNQHGGFVQKGFQLNITAPAGTIYYTTDGSDPRRVGGAVSTAAKTLAGPLTINEAMTVKARVQSGANWSALNEADFYLIQTNRSLLITEIMYNPGSTNGLDDDDLEFVELKNVSNAEVDLSGMRFTNGISYVFPIGKKLSPGRFVVLVRNPEAFTNWYPSVAFDGEYTNKLSDSGEQLALIHAAGAPLFSVSYSDNTPWPISADGAGFSLVSRNPNANPNPNDPANWRASARRGGSPGQDDPALNVFPILVNEVLTHTDLPAVDSIELHNPNTEDVDVGGWFLTDDRLTPKKFLIPSPKVIQAGGYIVFTEADFNTPPGGAASFSLSSHGDEVFLYSADSQGNLSGFSDGFSFGGAQNGVTFGRYTNSVGEVLFPAQVSNTLETANSGPLIGPVVINEIRYAPSPGDEEFVELRNRTGAAIKLYDTERPTNRWRISGIDFTFPEGAEIPANGYAVVASVTPSIFRSHNSIPINVPVFGPFNGALQDNGELIELQRPDAPDENVVPYINVDEVRYNDQSPWPVEAAIAGSSLERLNAGGFSNDPNNWRASFGQASPGIDNDGNRPPQVNAGLDGAAVSAVFPVDVNIAAAVADDGKPAPGSLQTTWTQVSGPGVVLFANPNAASTTASLPGVGRYVLRITVSDGEMTANDEVEYSVDRPLSDQVFVPTGSRWRFLDNGSNQGTAWRGTNFADSTWKEGPARLGYGNDGEITPVEDGPDDDRYVTTYFRHTFNVQNVAGLRDLTVRLLRDDGGVVYLNEEEIFRSNMPEGVTITSSTRPTDVVGNADEHTFFEKLVSPTLLRAGKNVLAVEIHQISTNSSDIALDLELIGKISAQNAAPIVSAGPDIAVKLPQSANLQGSVVDDGLPISPGAPVNSWTKVSGPGSVVFGNPAAARTTAAFTSPGEYVLRLSSTDGEFTLQDEMTVTVTSDDSYGAWKAQYFTGAELNDPNISGDQADPDQDTLTNIAEFIAGTHPRNAQSFLGLGSILTETGVGLRFEAQPGRRYEVITRENVDNGIWSIVRGVEPAAAAEIVEVEVPIHAEEPNRFYRVTIPQR